MIGRYVYVICNGCGEPCGPDLFVSADDARSAARQEGWRYRKTRAAVGPDEEPTPGGDYCPTCAANLDKEKVTPR